MKLYELCPTVGMPKEVGELSVKGVKTDSRKTEKGDLFVCIRGLHHDSHDFIDVAVKRGAAAVMVCEDYVGTADVPLLRVPDTRAAVSEVYNNLYGRPSEKLHLIGVTGTNGKTSVTFMLKAIFETALRRCGLIGTVSCYSGAKEIGLSPSDPLANMTTPDPEELYRLLAMMAEDGVEYVFMEVSSHALALGKADALHFDAAVFTNLTPEHLDFHGNMESYFGAKKKLFSLCDKAIINIDDKYGEELFRSLEGCRFSCSASGKQADFRAGAICENGVDGNEYRLLSKDRSFVVRTPIPGSFSVINSLEAASCALVLGISPSVIMTALASLLGVCGRMERVKLGMIADYSVFIDYAHTPDALENLLVSARSIRLEGERIVLVFGCGGDRDRTKRAQMGKIAAKYADFVIATSDNSRSEDPMTILCEIEEGLGDCDYVIIKNRRHAIAFAIREAREGDIILLAGKGHEEYEIDRTGRHFFSEKEIVREAAGKYRSERKKK